MTATKILKQQFDSLTIKAMGLATPPEILTTDQIERELSEIYSQLKFSAGRLEFLTGVSSRGLWPISTTPSQIATIAAHDLFSKNNIDPQKVDLVIYAGVCRDCLEPATASFVHHALNLRSDCSFFDLSNACLGMLDALVLAGNLLASPAYKNILIVTGEHAAPLYAHTMGHLKNEFLKGNLSRKDFRPMLANFTLGSSGVAMLVTNEESTGLKINRMAKLTDSSSSSLCKGSNVGNLLMMETDSETLMERGLTLAQNLWQNARSYLYPQGLPQLVFTHQVGHMHHRELLSRLELTEITSPTTFKEWGNTGSAALPMALALHLFQANTTTNLDNIALLGIGSGLSTLMIQGDFCV